MAEQYQCSVSEKQLAAIGQLIDYLVDGADELEEEVERDIDRVVAWLKTVPATPAV